MALKIELDPAEPGPIYLQIANRLRDAAVAGTLAPGVRLPSARALASQLAVARGTIDAAYAVLAGEGAIETRGGSGGTIVSPALAGRGAMAVQTAMPFLVEKDRTTPTLLPFRMGLPALDAFPRKLWSSLTARAVRQTAPADMVYPDPAGFVGLRQAVAAYLGVARGIACTADDVLITAGFQGALTLARHVLLRAGDAVWVEDPGRQMTHQALEAGGARLVPIRVDRDGLRVAAGIAAAPRARLAVVTPAHQSPLGVALSLPRRLDLLAWAAEANAWVLEDDYDGEFHYAGKPLPALKSLDQADRVLYCGSFSKVLYPALRLGYVVPPRELHDTFHRTARLLTAGSAELEQRVVAAFMERGAFPRHLRRMRTLYAARRKALAAAITTVFGDRATMELEAGGMHLLVRFPQAAPDSELARLAQKAGLAVTALSSLALAHDCGQGLLLSFTNIPEPDAEAMVRRLAAAIL